MATTIPDVVKRQNIGPSHYSTILGYNSFKTVQELKEEIEIGFTKSEPANKAVNLGLEKEHLVIKLYEQDKKVSVKKAHWVRTGRILAKADGLIGPDGGIEIKCHYGKDRPFNHVPIYYLVQILGYLHIYKRQWWDLVSCCFNEKGEITKHRVHRVQWKDFSKPWLEFWYPQILDFIKEASWSD